MMPYVFVIIRIGSFITIYKDCDTHDLFVKVGRSGKIKRVFRSNKVRYGG